MDNDEPLARSVERLKTLRARSLKKYMLTYRQLRPLIDGLNPAQKERYEEIEGCVDRLVENYDKKIKELEPLEQKCEQGTATIEERHEFSSQMSALLREDFKTLEQCAAGTQKLLIARVADDR